jgi:hypothetical protein
MGSAEPERVAEMGMREAHPAHSPIATGLGPSNRPSRLRKTILTAGLVAGLASWLLGEAVYGTFRLPPELSGAIDFSQSTRMALEKAAITTKNATLTFGLLGAVLGVALGVAGGLERRSTGAAVVAGVVGLVLGGAVGAQMTWALTPIAERQRVLASESMLFVLMIHCGIRSAIGAAGGLAFGLGLGGRSTIVLALLGGLIGASLGTVAYDLVGTLAFPTAETASALSITWDTRLLNHLCVAIPASLGVAVILGVQAPRAPTELANSSS